MSSKKWLSPLAALVDQSWLSLLSFAMSMAFIRRASKQEYALYILLQSAIMMVQGVQNALFIAPQATIYPSSLAHRRSQIINTAGTGQGIFAVCAALFCAVGWLAYTEMAGQNRDLIMGGALAVSIIGLTSREGARAIHYVKGNAERALSGDAVYGCALLVCLALLIAINDVTAKNVLLILGLSGLLALARTGVYTTKPIMDPHVLREFWSCSRWALPGTLVTWINLSSYPYVVVMTLGAAAVADINAARLFLVPATLGVAAWSNLMRPKISALMALNDTEAVRRLSLQSLLLALFGLGLFAIFLIEIYPFLQRVLGPKYHGLLPLALGWTVFFALNFVRGIFSATLMSTHAGYRQIHHLSWLALAVVLPSLLIFSHLGSLWVIAILCSVELILGSILARMALHLWSKGLACAQLCSNRSD